MDGIDAVLVDIAKTKLTIVTTHQEPLPQQLKQELLSLCVPGPNEINRMGQLDNQIGLLFAHTANKLIEKSSLDKSQIKAVGSHGQTIRHHPQAIFPFTLQIGNPNIIATETGVTTVADFRRRDMAYGGEGAPLVPAFHAWMFHSNKEDRAVINIGGITNITILNRDAKKDIIGFDLGPGNTLLDSWIYHIQQLPYDDAGKWAATGHIHTDLLNKLLADAYFHIPPPKSTGREHFNLVWLQTALQQYGKSIKSEDVQATLVELTSILISNALCTYLPKCSVLLCGGGTYNHYLRERIIKNATGYRFHSTEKLGIAPQWIEAAAFAWLARQTLKGLPGNIPSVTGARASAILGGIYLS
ncbi:anhydro-N-acetylmuramic acid kinase [soil metagenome]